MSTVERCVHDLPANMCGACMDALKPRGRHHRPAWGPWFTAAFDGECDGPCGREIQEGDTIRSDGEGGWLCDSCGHQ
jgi:hypothetical protein